MQETQVLPLGREDYLEKGMATHPNILFFSVVFWYHFIFLFSQLFSLVGG